MERSCSCEGCRAQILQLMDLEELRFDLLALKMRCPRHLHILTAIAFSLPFVLTLSLSTIIQDFPCIDYDMVSALQVPQHAGCLLNSQAQCFLSQFDRFPLANISPAHSECENRSRSLF